jgi:predicted aldo/keto reductase-like oxidoreductase
MSEKKDGLTRRDLLKAGTAASAAALLAPRDLLAADDKTPQVPKKVLGKTKKQIPILLFGCAMDLDERFDPKLAEAMRYGVNYYDTADCYSGGTSETAVGNFLARTKSRDKAWITSKSDEHDPDGFEEVVNTSLKKLQTNRIDLYYLHAVKRKDVFTPELAKRVEKLKKEGKILHFGFSCHAGNVVELMNQAAGLPWIESIMFRYNFRRYGDAELNKAIDACAKADIGLIAMKTQGSEAHPSKVASFQGSGKWTKHQAVLKAAWEDPRIAACVSHMDSFEKLRQNIAAALDKSKLGALDREELHRYAQATRAYACEGCDHICNAAVEGDAQIGDTMRFLMYHDVYGEQDKAKMLFKTQLPVTAQKIDRMDFAGASRACPHGVDVAAHMRRAKDIFLA